MFGFGSNKSGQLTSVSAAASSSTNPNVTVGATISSGGNSSIFAGVSHANQVSTNSSITTSATVDTKGNYNATIGFGKKF